VPCIWTIGYERLMPPALVAELEHAGVRRVLDVRYRPQSRRPGMSKTRLAHLLREHDIAYEHRRALGTPPEIRPLYRTGATRRAARAFHQHLELTAAAELATLSAELDRAPATALLCLEADPAHCHRRVITEALRDRRSDIEVVHL
jgi:uncharacterized protein (DUF488 family)